MVSMTVGAVAGRTSSTRSADWPPDWVSRPGRAFPARPGRRGHRAQIGSIYLPSLIFGVLVDRGRWPPSRPTTRWDCGSADPRARAAWPGLGLSADRRHRIGRGRHRPADRAKTEGTVDVAIVLGAAGGAPCSGLVMSVISHSALSLIGWFALRAAGRVVAVVSVGRRRNPDPPSMAWPGTGEEPARLPEKFVAAARPWGGQGTDDRQFWWGLPTRVVASPVNRSRKVTFRPRRRRRVGI